MSVTRRGDSLRVNYASGSLDCGTSGGFDVGGHVHPPPVKDRIENILSYEVMPDVAEYIASRNPSIVKDIVDPGSCSPVEGTQYTCQVLFDATPQYKNSFCDLRLAVTAYLDSSQVLQVWWDYASVDCGYGSTVPLVR